MNVFKLKDAYVVLYDQFLDPSEAISLFDTLKVGTAWRQDKLIFSGIERLIPRLQQWYGTGGQKYTYSGLQLIGEPFPEYLMVIKNKIEHYLDYQFNTVLVNYYRNGNDTIHWHADDEPELGEDPIIASLSLGITRDFCLKHNTEAFKEVIPLKTGSLLVMSGKTQSYWKHSLPRRKSVLGERINLTFRQIK